MAVENLTKLHAFVEDTKKDIDEAVSDVHKQVHLESVNRITEKTPVDRGFARGSWQSTLDAPASDDPERSPAEASTDAAALEIPPYGASYITSNRPYIDTLESGGYPNPPKKGTYLKEGQTKGRARGPGYFKFSSGGYSKQAPQGMVAISLEEVAAIFGGED